MLLIFSTKLQESNNISDKELLSEYKTSHDQKKLLPLYERYTPLIYGVALKYLQNKTDAEDLTMNVYEHIAKKLKSHEVDNFKSWLYVVTKNLCYEKLRKEKRNKEKENNASVVYSETVFHLDSVDNQEVLIRLNTCLKKLNDEQKSCVEDFYYNNMSYNVIAAKYGLSWNRVRSYIQNGRRMLKNCIEKSA